jgi:benzoate 4-monooxygenase
LSAAFASSHLVDWEHKIVDKVERLLTRLDALHGQVVDWREWSNLFTLDAILDIAMSHQPRLMEADDDMTLAEDTSGRTREVRMRDCNRAVNRAIEPIVWSPKWYPALKWIASWLPGYRKTWELANAWPDIVRSFVSRRLQEDPDGDTLDDLFACLLRNTKGQPLYLSKAELVAETVHLRKSSFEVPFSYHANSNQVDAGSITTAIALANVLYFLCRNHSQLKKLRAELDAAFPVDQIIPTYAQVRSLPFLRACLDESMRLRPPLSAGLQRKTPSEGASIAGTWIDGGINVSAAPHIIHRNSSMFGAEVDSFRPERWLECEDATKTSMRRHELTFSAGGRICIGKNITYMEQSILISAIVRRYDFSLPSDEWEMDLKEYFTLVPGRVPVVFRRREVLSNAEERD